MMGVNSGDRMGCIYRERGYGWGVESGDRMGVNSGDRMGCREKERGYGWGVEGGV